MTTLALTLLLGVILGLLLSQYLRHPDTDRIDFLGRFGKVQFSTDQVADEELPNLGHESTFRAAVDAAREILH